MTPSSLRYVGQRLLGLGASYCLAHALHLGPRKQAYTEFDFQLHMQHFTVLLADKPGDMDTNVLLELKLTHVNTRLQSIVPQT